MVKKKVDEFAKRMKAYEYTTRFFLPMRLPILIRIDGSHFHTYTKGMDKPFDAKLAEAFWETAKFIGPQIPGCKMFYHQSDELSLLVMNNDKLTTQAWFDNNLQKIISTAVSLATAKFNEIMYPYTKKLATFDCRVWVLPPDEVCNYFLWRQNDATKNSVSMVAQSHFKQKELQGLNRNMLQDKLMLEKGINWNDILVWQKRGAAVIKQERIIKGRTKLVWEVDDNIPIFSQDRTYIDQYIYPLAIEEKAVGESAN